MFKALKVKEWTKTVLMISQDSDNSESRVLPFYTVYQENQYFVINMLLLKNPQFLPNHNEIL